MLGIQSFMSKKSRNGKKYFLIIVAVVALYVGFLFLIASPSAVKGFDSIFDSGNMQYAAPTPVPPPVLDVVAYNHDMVALANYGTTTLDTGISATSSAWSATSSSISSRKNPWPVSTVYPNVGAILPASRIVAYYGNFLSADMGILGQYPIATIVQKLQAVATEWQAADPSTPVIPAIDYIAVTAQGSPGADGKYRLRMPADQIEQAISLADQMHGLVFLDIQPGLSTLQTEIPLLAQYLKMPEVELAIDPEFSMKGGQKPGTVIGTMDAADVNYAAEYLAKIVRESDLPPKILIVHRFTEDMVTNYQDIKPLPEVQIVMNMDGWSSPDKKVKTYDEVITTDPVQFAGIKLFYKNDALPPSTGLLTPAQILSLKPQPSFVEYQ